VTRPSQSESKTKIGFSCSKRRKATERGNLLNFFPSFFLSFFRSFVSPSGVRTALPARSKVSITRPRQGLNQVSSRTQRNTIRTHAGNSPDTFPRDWLKKDNFPLIVGFLAWTIPSSIPVGAFGGHSLFWELNQSIADLFKVFPTGPALTDPFWIYLITWHLGLFSTLTFAKIGYEGRKEGYFGPVDDKK